MTESESLSSGLKRFKTAMTSKFEARTVKHGPRSVTVVSDSLLREPGVFPGLIEHFHAEVNELIETGYQDSSEQVDVANMAFLMWWHLNPAVVEKKTWIGFLRFLLGFQDRR